MIESYHYDVASSKFTAKKRDSESGLDNFGARYYSSQFGGAGQGRGVVYWSAFTSITACL